MLSLFYLGRAAVMGGFLVVPVNGASVLVFSALMGLLWLGTVPLTSGLVAQIFGPRYLGALFGIVFLSHQLGSFLGAWLGGYVYDTTGSYDAVWLTAVALRRGGGGAALADPRPAAGAPRARRGVEGKGRGTKTLGAAGAAGLRWRMVPWSRCLRCMPALALALLLALGTTGAAVADQNDPALDGLFRDLKAAQSPQLVRQIELQIWARWFETGSEEMDRMLLAGDRALSSGQYNRSLRAPQRGHRTAA